jgi:6,7-dimethyl-8-ribityllumazine synthase
LKIALVVSDFNFDVTSQMAERARRHAEFLGAEVVRVVHVPGVFDMTLAIKKLLRRKDVDGVAMIGAVIKGDTRHDELIAGAAAKAAVDLALEFDKPVGLGITGPGMDRMQALDRIDNAKNAVESVARMIKVLKEIGE